MSHWVKAIPYADLQQKQKTIFRHQGKQIALFDTENGVFACNNRCPHEGYPLREGSLSEGCLLTCNWHNWKFDLRTGENLYGGDQLAVYATKIDDDIIWVDITEPPFEQRYTQIMSNLHEAFDDHSYDRIARELARLRLLGTDPLDAIREVINWSYQHLEFGWTHAYAGMADWLTLYNEYANDSEIQLICLLETVGHVADDVLREPEFPYSDALKPFNEEAFLAAIERQDEAEAISLLRDALSNGIHFDQLEQVFSRAALAHYNDFGHSLIYVNKAGTLIEQLGESVELPILLSLTRSLVYASREDLIPEFRGYASALAEWRQNGKAENNPDIAEFSALSINKSLAYTVAHSSLPSAELFQILLAVNADHFLHYDMAYQFQTDNKIADNVGWLSFTHGITFANAVRKQCEKFPELWPAGLLQMACFSGRNKPYTNRQLDDTEWSVADANTFFREQIDNLFDHGKEEYIVSVHLLKTLLAAREELVADPSAEVKALLPAALNRFLNSPLKRKHTRRTANQAMAFVTLDG